MMRDFIPAHARKIPLYFIRLIPNLSIASALGVFAWSMLFMEYDQAHLLKDIIYNFFVSLFFGVAGLVFGLLVAIIFGGPYIVLLEGLYACTKRSFFRSYFVYSLAAFPALLMFNFPSVNYDYYHVLPIGKAPDPANSLELLIARERLEFMQWGMGNRIDFLLAVFSPYP